eukprot:Plantae.Rhodophyta-Rhodochaete_pulchella.ctg8761.p1 GENE.Plantae.Rhodophyta-Rhodochaete_pulchella.ctg8761~~Plantae.Rhodophyta-Rhodochaete_pulchella.ctg8761.p1  ORF type:complete len:634 (-),score=98.92 Plantae.Rhodophyta-Rhodochaete_pulchella.ctg8761:964-2661(-)
MLILYIRAIYHHKRPFFGVEWVTGPLAYTKCLVHTSMPMSVPSPHLFYPQFHYVPNPSAIDVTAFPDAYAFQFGYTCSGLGNWVAQNNRCRKASQCQYHSKKTDWPFGALLSLETAVGSEDTLIPKTIHQFAFQSDGDTQPARWMRTWQEAFTRANPGWTYKVWTLAELKAEGKAWFCANVYRDDKPMDAVSLQLLAAELVYKFGGYYVPLSTSWTGISAAEDLFQQNDKESSGLLVLPELGIIGSAVENMDTLAHIQDLYDGAAVGEADLELGLHLSGAISVLGYSDSVASYAEFPSWTRFLAVEEIYDMTMSSQAEPAVLSWGYDGQVPVYRLRSRFVESLRKTENRCLVVTDPKLFRYRSLRDALPGLIANLDEVDPDWDASVVGVEFESGEDSKEHYRLTSHVFSNTSMQFGVILNFKRTSLLRDLANPADLITSVAKLHDSAKIFCLVEKFADSKERSEIYGSMDTIRYAFKKLANHDAPFDYTSTEMHGRLLKGFRNESLLSMEVAADDEGRVMYRSWNDDGGLNCEAKLNRGTNADVVEWMRVYFNHQTVYEITNKPL